MPLSLRVVATAGMACKRSVMGTWDGNSHLKSGVVPKSGEGRPKTRFHTKTENHVRARAAMQRLQRVPPTRDDWVGDGDSAPVRSGQSKASLRRRGRFCTTDPGGSKPSPLSSPVTVSSPVSASTGTLDASFCAQMQRNQGNPRLADPGQLGLRAEPIDTWTLVHGINLHAAWLLGRIFAMNLTAHPASILSSDCANHCGSCIRSCLPLVDS